MAESVSAANEVKLTEAEIETLDLLDWGREQQDRYPTIVAILGARLSAREPDNALVLPDPKGGCVCEPYSQSAGGVYVEHLVEYEPACPVHSEHVYNPRTGVWDLASPASAREWGNGNGPRCRFSHAETGARCDRVLDHEGECRSAHDHPGGIFCDDCPDALRKNIKRLLVQHQWVTTGDPDRDCACGWRMPFTETHQHSAHLADVLADTLTDLGWARPVPVSGVPTEAVREGPCARCGKPDSTTEPPNTLPVCQECAYQLGREVLADQVRELHSEENEDGWCLSCGTCYPCPTAALVQRAAETNERSK